MCEPRDNDHHTTNETSETKRSRAEESARERWESLSREINARRRAGEFTDDPSRPCRVCRCTRVRTIAQEQRRSADEPMTVVTLCANGHTTSR
jgi:DNA-directed RNA polymerase subunit M/transcription elongation factor TFIIS